MKAPYFKLNYYLKEVYYSEFIDDEPIGWDKVEIICKRDYEFHGFNYQYTDGDTELQFDVIAGLVTLESIYAAHGNDGYCILEYGFKDGSTYIKEFEGKLNFNNYKRRVKKGFILSTCTIETSGFHEQIATRKDTAINIWDKKTLSGAAITAYRYSTIKLKSSSIERRTVVDEQTETTSASSASMTETTPHPYWFKITIPDDTGVDAIDHFYGSPAAILNDDGALIDRDFFDVPFILAQESGRYNLSWRLNFYLDAYLTEKTFGFHPYFGMTNVYMFVMKKASGTDITDDLYTNDKAHSVWSFDEQTKTFQKDIYFEGGTGIDLAIGDELHIFFKFEYDGVDDWKKSGVSLTNRARYFLAQASTSTAESDCYAFKIKDFLSTILESLTDSTSILESDLLDFTTGTFGKYAIIDGYGLRNFNDPVNKADNLKFFNFSLKDFLTGLKALIPISVSYENDSGTIRFRLEDIWHCYKDVEIIKLYHVDNLQYETAKEFIYNEVEIGYQKYPDDGSKLMDEYLTKLGFTLPITTLKNKISLLSTFVAANYAIEETRRYQFHIDKDKDKDTTETSTKWDENVFIISITDDLKSESRENFEVKNISASNDSSDLYNLRITPKRNFYRHAPWINSCLAYKKGTEVIKNILSIKNSDATTTNTDSTDIQGEIKEKDSIIIDDFDSRKAIFVPTWITFKARLNIDEIITIKNALTNRVDAKKNGYISYVDENGTTQQGWLFEMRYNPSKEMVSFKLLKKGLSLSGGQGNCQDYASYTSAQFEALSSLPSFIEDCTFDNFE